MCVESDTRSHAQLQHADEVCREHSSLAVEATDRSCQKTCSVAVATPGRWHMWGHCHGCKPAPAAHRLAQTCGILRGMPNVTTGLPQRC